MDDANRNKRGPYASEACRLCRENKRRCIVNQGTTFWSETNPCVKCKRNHFKCEKGPNTKKAPLGRQAPSALQCLPVLNNSLSKWQYQRCLEEGVKQASQLFQGHDWSMLKDGLLSKAFSRVVNSEQFSPLLHCALILPHLHRSLVSEEDLKSFKSEAMAQFGREFVHPTLPTVWGTILLFRCPSIFDASCKRDLSTAAHIWLCMSHQYDGLKHVSKTVLMSTLELLHADEPLNICCPCLFISTSQSWPIANDPQPAATEAISKIPTDQISPRQSYDTGNVHFDLDSVDDVGASLMNSVPQLGLSMPRTGSPTQNTVFSGVQTPYSPEAPPPYLNQSTNPQSLGYLPQAIAACASYGTSPATSFVLLNQAFPPQFNVGGVHDVSRTSNDSVSAAQGRSNLPQPPRKGSYAEVLRRGL